tara:strand:- start:60 stop:626 length:567 start_codon:yes stop_codon:yes gene_type:complete
MSCAAFYLMLNLGDVLVLFDNKIAEYYDQATTLGFYSTASGFNITTIICLFFAIRFYLEYRRQRFHNRMSSAKDLISTFPVSFGLVCGCLLFTMIFGAGIFAVFSDRLWQMTLPLLLMIDGFTNREESNFILKELTITKMRLVSFILSRILDIALLYYIVVNLLLRYPLTNAFSWFFGEIQLEVMPIN